MEEKVEIYLNSKYATKYNNSKVSDCVFTIPNIEADMLDEHVYISLMNAVIPYSFYNINSTNKVLNLTVNGNPYTITLPQANYNINTLIAEIQLQIALFNVVNDRLLTLTYSNKTNKIIFNHSLTTFSILGTSTCLEVLGFESTTNAVNISGTIHELTSLNGINLFLIRQIYFSCDNFILNNINSTNPNDASILASINVTGNPNSIITYENSSSKHLIHHLQNINQLRVRLTTQDGAILELNGIHWSATLEVTILKK